MTTTTFQHLLTSAEILRQITARRISLTCCFDGKLWMASVDLKGDGVVAKNCAVRAVSAIASTPIGAISDLVAKLDADGISQPEEKPMMNRLFVELENLNHSAPSAKATYQTED